MELVYLWVENYKNIHQQGFNFSPRFTCSYENDELKIIDKEKTKEPYLKNFFGDNINITAVVGENGSGKSSVLEILAQMSYEDDIKEIGSFLYLLTNGESYKCFTHNLKATCIFTECINKPPFLNTRESVRGHNKVNLVLTQDLNIAYLNISHIERDKIIKKDERGDLDKLIYLGVYAKNDFTLYKEESTKPTYTEFNPSRFNFSQIQRIINILTLPLYKDLIWKYLKIKSLYSLSISYSKKEVNDKLTAIENDDELSVTKEKITALKNLLKINRLIIDSKEYEQFFKLVNHIFKWQGEIPFKFQFYTQSDSAVILSGGENTILFYIEKIALLFDKIDKDKSTILLFDEVELYLHPNWQKQVLSIILDIFKIELKDKKIHLIITSHSPFILSDLPKENVIFLKNGKQVDVDINPFGANIHTLLSHGFFMKDGLMGEFAKSKIEEIKKFYERVKKLEKRIQEHAKTKVLTTNSFQRRKKRFENVHKIIGEPFLQTIIGNYLNEIEIILSNLDKETFIDNEIKRLQELKASFK